MPAQRKWLVMSGALLLIGLTVWQVTAKRDDWPLSNFNLYSFIAGRSGSRYVVVAFGPEGETKIARWQLRLVPSPNFALARLERHPRRMKHFKRQVREAYAAMAESHREKTGTELPEFAGFRIIREKWKIRSHMKGADKPERRLIQSLYLPPQRLVQRIEQEAKGAAEALPPAVVPEGDRVLEAENGILSGAASIVSDDYAHGSAVLLKARKGDSGSITFAVDSDASELWLLMRVRTKGKGTPGTVSVKLDGKRPRGIKKGAAKVDGSLRGGWVWASGSDLAAPPVHLELRRAKPSKAKPGATRTSHQLTIQAKKGAVVIDQVWLTRDRRELPIDNQPVSQGATP